MTLSVKRISIVVSLSPQNSLHNKKSDNDNN
jgi:hypothetical protein